jgi:CHAT domain-containing protein/formylglycine-generating enzyme required for sulfatase activity
MSQVGLEKYTEAFEQFEKFSELVKDRPLIRQSLLTSDLSWALAGLRTGQEKLVITVLDEIRQSIETVYGESSSLAATSSALLATAHQASGNLQGAADLYPTSIELLIRNGLADDAETLQTVIRAAVLQGYIEMAASPRGQPLLKTGSTDPVAYSFSIADYARNSSVLQSLRAQSLRQSINEPESGKIIRAEQDTSHQIKALQHLLMGIPSGSREALEIRNRIEVFEQKRRAMVEQIEREYPNYALMKSPQPATAQEIRQLLSSDEQMISIYITADRTYLWSVVQDADPTLQAIEIGEEAIHEMVDRIRTSLAPQITTLADIPAFPLSEAEELFNRLLKPVLEDKQELLVVPHKSLGHLPLGLLPTESSTIAQNNTLPFSGYRNVPWLAKKVSITNLPASTALRTLRGQGEQGSTNKQLVAFADAIFNDDQLTRQPSAVAQQTAKVTSRGLPVTLRNSTATSQLDSALLRHLPRLQETSDEVREIADAFGGASTSMLILGLDANEQRVKTMDLSGANVVVFATHGLVPGDLDGLQQPALALSSPELSQTEGDGLLTMDEILGLKLNADLILLSACNTGAGDGAGAEAVSGLGQAFFYAGSESLLVSNWPVETESAKLLTTNMFQTMRSQPNISRAEALRQSSLGVMQADYLDPQGTPRFAYAHPIFWAPFSLIGDNGNLTSATPALANHSNLVVPAVKDLPSKTRQSGNDSRPSQPSQVAKAGVPTSPTTTVDVSARISDGVDTAITAYGPHEMVSIKSDCFEMGTYAGQPGYQSDSRAHNACVNHFMIDRYEVTFAAYDAFAKATNRDLPDDEGMGRGLRAVINVDWEDARAYAAWATEQFGIQFRLPTEAEWEYACRGGGRIEDFCGGNDPAEVAVYDQDSTLPVGSRKPNALGLYDMSGNAWEMTCSPYDVQFSFAQAGYAGGEETCVEESPRGDVSLVFRGGGWDSDTDEIRSTRRRVNIVRSFAEPYISTMGFRLVADH